MKKRRPLFVLILICLASLSFFVSKEAKGDLLVSSDASVYTLSNNSIDLAVFTFEPCIINSHVRTVEPSHFENTKSYEKPFKHKLFCKENLQIERSIKNYIVYNNFLAHYHAGYIQLQRLNI